MSLYVGRRVNPATMAPGPEFEVLDPDGLVRHAVCLGMTGSGKTGLCVALLEELAMAGVPLVIVDPKGDLTNLALAFKGQRPEDFAPWVNPAAAKREGKTVDEYAAQTAERWRQGLADWQVGPERVAAFVDSARVTIYTPGSNAGVAVDVLGSFAAPGAVDEEGMVDLVVGTVSALLALVGLDSDPVTDPAHLVLSRVLDTAWRAGEGVDLAALVTRLVDPPFDKIGVFPVDTFFPRKDRLALAMQLNGLLASPAFAPWSQGVPLDPDRFLAPHEDGRTPVSVFSLAHLDEPRRMFFVAQLLARMVAWSRRQPGTSALRALVYFDEVYGFLPPYPKNPPTKKPVLTLMKQARAVGLGTMLVSQNPVDLDYATLANAGTWMIGRLQTPQDRDKVVDGLAAAEGDKALIGDWLARLPARTFVIRDDKGPRLVHSRQVISFLRGPLTRMEIERLRGGAPTAGPPPVPSRVVKPPPAAAPTPPPEGRTANPPPAPSGYAYRWLHPDVAFSARFQPFFEASARPARADGRVEWEPGIYARLRLRFDEGQEFVLDRDEHRLFFPLGRGLPVPVEPAFEAADLQDGAPAEGFYAPLPAAFDETKELKALEKRVIDDVQRGETERMFRHRTLRLDSRAGESRDAFRDRVKQALMARADAEVARLQDSVAKDVRRLEDKKARLEQDVARASSDVQARHVNEAVNAGEALLGLFFGSRRVTTAVSSAVSRRQQSTTAATRQSRAEQDLDGVVREEYQAETALEKRIADIREKHLVALTEIEEVAVKLDLGDVKLDELCVVWVPVTRPV